MGITFPHCLQLKNENMTNFSTNIYVISEMIPKHNETVLVKIKGIGFWSVYS